MRVKIISILWLISLVFFITISGEAESKFTVPATAGWIDTGIQVTKGDTIQFLATGQAKYGYEGSPVNNSPTTDPDGNRFVNNIKIEKRFDSTLIDPSAPIGSLVGKIGLGNDIFFIGSSNQQTMPASGTIMLRYNDVEGEYDNNEGSYEVTISKSASPIILPGISKIGFGSTPIVNTNWVDYIFNGQLIGIYVDVDTSSAGFTSTPIYITSLGGDAHHWSITGASSIYDAKPTSFRVYLRESDGTALNSQYAKDDHWYIQWIGIEPT